MGNISIVIGSWGSYNECNNKSLGSEWLDLSNYDDWSEIEEELTKEGFELNGLDEELFIQDIDGLDSNGLDCDNTHPKDFFELLQEADVLSNDYNYELMSAFLEIRTFDDFKSLVQDKGSNWSDDVHYYKGYDWSDYGRMIFDESCYKIPEVLENFIDFESYGRYMGDYYAEQCDSGILEIIR
ncbi:MAG: antirestriction protein ArdA [Christensenellales bacterium]